jgi:hypothetical protein
MPSGARAAHERYEQRGEAFPAAIFRRTLEVARGVDSGHVEGLVTAASSPKQPGDSSAARWRSPTRRSMASNADRARSSCALRWSATACFPSAATSRPRSKISARSTWTTGWPRDQASAPASVSSSPGPLAAGSRRSVDSAGAHYRPARRPAAPTRAHATARRSAREALARSSGSRAVSRGGHSRGDREHVHFRRGTYCGGHEPAL